MSSIQKDLSIFNKFNFERKPVGIKFLLGKPVGIERLGKNLALCEMFKEAQESEPFYAARDNLTCIGPLLLGMEESEPVFESGQVGARDGIFEEARANRRIYHYLPRLAKGTVRYVAFSPIDKLTFKPDVLTVTTNVSQAEILLRAICYSTGRLLITKSTPVIMCAWLFIHPYISGEPNFSVTGLGSGMKAKKLLPEGLILISIPYDLLSMVADNLQNMPWVLTVYTLRDEEKTGYFEKLFADLKREYSE